MKWEDGRTAGMMGSEMRAIRRKLGLSKNQFAIELGYTGTSTNNVTQIKRYEGDRRLIPLYIARLAWLLGQLSELPEWPHWDGYVVDSVPDAQTGKEIA